MKPFTKVVGPAAPLMLQNIDTDVIIRIERLAALKPDQMGDYAFEALRFLRRRRGESRLRSQPATVSRCARS